MNRRQIILFSAFSALLAVSLQFLSHYPLPFYLKPFHVLLTVFLIIFVPGINLTYLIEKLTRRHYDLPAFVSLAILSSLTIPPFLLVTFYQYTDYIDSALVLFTYTLFLLLPYMYWAVIFVLRRWLSPPIESLLVFPRLRLSALLFHPFTLVFLLLLGALVYNLTRFSFLPVPDSYSWLINFSQSFSINTLPLSSDFTRRSFSALLSAFFYLLHLDPFFTFKYFFPLLTLLIMPPLWLAGRYLSTRLWQFAFLFTAVFISPTIILEVTYIRQQVVFLIFLYFIISLSIYAIQVKDKTIYYLLFIFTLFGTIIHPAFLIILLTSIIAWFITHLRTVRRFQFTTLLLLILLFPLAKKAALINMFVRIYEQARASFINALTGRWNLQFPSFYINSDGYEMSWPGVVGVLKYYAYYVGPAAMLILGLFVFWLFTNQKFRRRLTSRLHNTVFVAIILPFILFFFIAEIAPRFGNIAFLPERAWQYLSILAIFVLFFLIKDGPVSRWSNKRSQLIFGLLILSSITAFSGAAYINSLNKYSMPDYDFRAADWMVKNLSESSMIFSSSSKNIIRYHANMNFIGLNENMYAEPDPLVILNHLSSQLPLTADLSSNLIRVSAYLSDIRDTAVSAKGSVDETITKRHVSTDTYQAIDAYVASLQTALAKITEHNESARDFHQSNAIISEKIPPLYIFYSTTHPKNLMADRPYQSSFTADQNVTAFPALDHTPDYFSRVYTDDHNVIIWQVKVQSFLPS